LLNRKIVVGGAGRGDTVTRRRSEEVGCRHVEKGPIKRHELRTR
jgi:hypothetical protein